MDAGASGNGCRGDPRDLFDKAKLGLEFTGILLLLGLF